MQKRMGVIRIHASPAPDVRHAPAFTDYFGGPRCTVKVALEAADLKPGGVAGLALSRRRYAWLGLEHGRDGFTLIQFAEETGRACRVPLRTPQVWLRAECDFVNSTARFSYSTDGQRYVGIGEPYSMDNGQVAFEGVRCSLFSHSTQVGVEGGHADFDCFLVTWP